MKRKISAKNQPMTQKKNHPTKQQGPKGQGEGAGNDIGKWARDGGVRRVGEFRRGTSYSGPGLKM